MNQPGWVYWLFVTRWKVQVFTNTPSNYDFATRILMRWSGFCRVPVLNWRRFNENVLTNSRTFSCGGILTWGRFRVHTHRLKAEQDVRGFGEFDFIISKFNRRLRISQIASLGNLDSDSEDKISIRPFIFRGKVSKGAKIRNRYSQVPHLTQDTYGKVTNSQLYTTNESQEVSPFPAGDHKAQINRRTQRHNKHKKHKRSTKEVPPWNGQ